MIIKGALKYDESKIDEEAAFNEAYKGPDNTSELSRCYLDLITLVVGFYCRRDLNMEYTPALNEILKHYIKVIHKDFIDETVYVFEDTKVCLDNHKQLINTIALNFNNLNNLQKCYLVLLEKLVSYRFMYSNKEITYEKFLDGLDLYIDRWYKINQLNQK